MSLHKRYMSGETEDVWRDIERTHDAADIEAVMRETYGRVSRNVDIIIERLRETGYRFESESGRHGEGLAPHRKISVHLGNAEDVLEERFGDLPALTYASTFLPTALHFFALVVGVIDLRQRYPFKEQSNERSAQSKAPASAGERALLEAMENALGGFQQRQADERAILESEDKRPHPSNDPVVARLGDWNPLVVDLENLKDLAEEREAEIVPLPMGGIGLELDIAPSFESKSNVPVGDGDGDGDGDGARLFLPNLRQDPMIFEAGRNLPFIDYLRAAVLSGGFIGVSYPIHPTSLDLRDAKSGLLLPEHPIFATLQDGLEAF
ncbi:MAG: hypothetical protein ABJN34_01775 [Litoreibacter sp.]|uniref:hypothetical protein n=1 Tax=Litoreibacter sp. TaxID=1969459 RepID=UPI00329A4C3F